MRRKFMALLLAAAVAAVSLAGCGGSSSSGETTAAATEAATEAAAEAETEAEEAETEETEAAADTAADLGDYPSGDVEIIIPYKVGGTTDLAVRGALDAIPSGAFPKTIIVTNMEGGSGLIGSEDFLQHAADGYTLGLVNCDLVLNYVTGATEINPMEDYIPLAAVEQDPYFLLAGKNEPFSTFEEFVAYAEENPGEVVVGVTGVGTVPNLISSVLINAGLDILSVPYDSAADAVAGVLSGEASICVAAMAAAVGSLESGDLVAIAATSADRSETLPDVPTMAEVDDRFADVNLLSWIMIALPAGTPDAIASYWQDLLKDAVASDEYAQIRENFYFETITITPDDLEDFIVSQGDYYSTLAD